MNIQIYGTKKSSDTRKAELIRQPIVRNGRQATVGYVPDVWKAWQSSQ